VKPRPPASIDAYLAALDGEKRAALARLRKDARQGSIRFPAETPRPAVLVRKRGVTRIAERAAAKEAR